MSSQSTGCAPTGNGLAKSILTASGEPYNIHSAAFLLVKGNTRKLDMFVVSQKDHKPMVGFLTMGWALIRHVLPEAR